MNNPPIIVAASQSQLAMVKPNPAWEETEMEREIAGRKRGKKGVIEKWKQWKVRERERQYREALVPHIRFLCLSLLVAHKHTHTHRHYCQLNKPCSWPTVVTHFWIVHVHTHTCINYHSSRGWKDSSTTTLHHSQFLVFLQRKIKQISGMSPGSQLQKSVAFYY